MFLANNFNQPDHQPPLSFEEWSIPTFKPGYLKQDVFTLPTELGLIGALNYFYTPRSKTLFPIFDEASGESIQNTTYTRSGLLPYAVGTGALIFTGLTLSNNNFYLGTQLRGFAHSLLLSELAVSTAKVTFQRKRPTYEAQIKGNHGEDTPDSRASFYSGHANHAFNFATYTSLMMFQFSNSTILSTIYSLASFSAASVISYSRVTNHAHNLTDVIVGAIMGTTIAGLTFFRVQEVEEEMSRSKNQSHVPIQWDILPGMNYDNNGSIWYSANINLEI